MGEIGTEGLDLSNVEGLAELFEEHRDTLVEIFVDEKDRRDGYLEPRYAGETLKGTITLKVSIEFRPKTGALTVSATGSVATPKRQARGVAGLLHDGAVVMFPSAEKTQTSIEFVKEVK